MVKQFRESLLADLLHTVFICFFMWCSPVNIRLDKAILKTSWRRLSSSSSEDILIKTNMFALSLRLQKTSSRRLQDVLVKTNIFVLSPKILYFTQYPFCTSVLTTILFSWPLLPRILVYFSDLLAFQYVNLILCLKVYM